MGCDIKLLLINKGQDKNINSLITSYLGFIFIPSMTGVSCMYYYVTRLFITIKIEKKRKLWCQIFIQDAFLIHKLNCLSRSIFGTKKSHTIQFCAGTEVDPVTRAGYLFMLHHLVKSMKKTTYLVCFYFSSVCHHL